MKRFIKAIWNNALNNSSEIILNEFFKLIITYYIAYVTKTFKMLIYFRSIIQSMI
jgi:accessory gene regulator protein AgrB